MTLKQIFIMYLASFVAMLISMYAMVYVWDHVYLNINKAYMSLLMVGAMGIANFFTMPHMFKTNQLKWAFLSFSLLITVFSFLAIRQQTLVDDSSFLHSMIPHHSSAILMCNANEFDDPEISELCTAIVETQREEIEIMENKLEQIN